MAPRHLLPALVILLVLSACVDRTPAPADTSAAPTDSVSGPDEPTTTPLTYPVAAPVTHTVWANDSFPVNENCSMTGCAAGMGRKTTVITEFLPAAVPVKLHVELDYGTSATSTIYGAPLFLLLYAGDATLYNFTYDRPQAGRDIFDWTLLKGGDPVTIEIMYSSPHPTGPEVAYTLLIDIRADPLSTPGAVPVELSLAAGDEFVVETPAGSPAPSLLLFDAAGRVVGSFPSATNRSLVRVPDAAGAGPVVVLLDADVDDARILTNATTSALRPLGLEYVIGTPRSTTSASVIEWDFQVDGMPLFVGLYARPTTPLWAEANLMEVQVASPLGVVVEGLFGCQGCITNDDRVQFLGSEMGHPNLVPGTYHARVDSTRAGTTGLDVGDFSVYFVR